MMNVTIIGGGRLGTCLARALATHGFPVAAVSCRTLRSARESVRLIGQGEAMTDDHRAAARGRLIFLCLPDDVIADVTRSLAAKRRDWTGRFVFHTSGLQPASLLAPLKARGAAVGSFHPAQSFPSKDVPVSLFRGTTFGLEGDREIRAIGRRIVHCLGGQVLWLTAVDKPLYHAACSLASNGLAALFDAAMDLLVDLGLDREAARDVLLPLGQGTLQNVKKTDPRRALTGPVVRGDAGTVKRHLDALRGHPGALDIYRALAGQALQIARERGLSAARLKALRRSLGDG
ncbi:MAG: DUF2520 domain-containing protein [Candidatus Aminicenantes bacterium]|nr:DUF2520 domain-containing protein [Candidatus Aminicenantes bacterium]